ncbi:MAG: hypothetical protein BroJett031_23520 [Betaproteobacteria bacterium]|nr:MAG: hypothetical protein BroJett031_23520 [Betaproteobacteria bacterium]
MDYAAASPIESTVPDGSARELLFAWRLGAAELAYIHSRWKGGFMSVGRAAIEALDDQYSRLRGVDGTMLLSIEGAEIKLDRQRMYSADMEGASGVDGVSLLLRNGDWLFLTSSAPRGRISFGQPQPSDRSNSWPSRGAPCPSGCCLLRLRFDRSSSWATSRRSKRR